MSASNKHLPVDSSINEGIQLDDFARKIGQKMVLDFRFFADENEGSEKLTPVTVLPEAIKQLIRDTDIGGVILFSENMVNSAQVIKLNTDLQQASQQSRFKQPLFISIDQEGGRVVRTPRDKATSFAGNMAIAATKAEFDDHYAKVVGRILAVELSALGINLNYAPDIDVNINPDNPVINVRAFSDQAEVVAELGLTMMNALQQAQVIACLKHFPGHGDTHVDSHIGLPLVDHDQNTIEQVDLMPFQWAIDQGEPGMIMTAHIQYPHLDSSTFVNTAGESIYKPATMSRKILTDLLRDKMKFKGVIATDALDMAGIASFYTIEDAVIATFKAGADLALMPFRVRCHADIAKFKQLVSNVAEKLRANEQDCCEVEQSLERINALKKQYALSQQVAQFCIENLAANITHAKQIITCDSHKQIEQQLAQKSLTLLKNQQCLPLKNDQNLTLHVVAYDQLSVHVFTQSLNKYWASVSNKHLTITSSLLSSYNAEQAASSVDAVDLLIVLHSSGKKSVVDLGGMEDLTTAKGIRENLTKSKTTKRDIFETQAQINELEQLLSNAQASNTKRLVISMQSPYDVGKFVELVDGLIVAFDASIYQDSSTKAYVGKGYDAVASGILGLHAMSGSLPIKI